MPSILFRFVVASLALIIAVILVYIWIYEYRTKQSSSNLSSNSLQEIDLPKDTTATPINLAEEYGWNRKPSITCEELSSIETASKMLNEKVKWSKRVGKVLKRDVKLNQNGKRVGRRVVIKYISGEEGQTLAQIYWTNEAKFCYISANTVSEAVEFERNNP